MALMAWSALITLVVDLWQAAAHILLTPSGVSGAAMTALAVSLLACAALTCLATACWLGRIAAAFPPACRAAALREKTWRAAFLPQRDPDAAGRPRPRAPSAAPAAA